MRTAIYARVSKKNRNGQTTSVDEQVELLTEATEKAGGTVTAIHTDRAVSASGRQKIRPGFDALQSEIAGGTLDAVALWETSRASRRLAEWATFRDLCIRHGVLWVTPNGIENPAKERLQHGVKAVVAEEEAEQTAQRVRRSLAASAKQGRPHGRDVYGYRRVYNPDTRAMERVEVEPGEAVIVQRIFTEAADGQALRAIARRLNDEGVLCPSASIAIRKGREPGRTTWTARQVHDLLTRDAYRGVRRHKVGDRLNPYRTIEMFEYAAQWEALIDEATFEKVQMILADPTRWTRQPEDNTVKHWLSGVLECGACHGPMRADKNKQGSRYYICANSRCRKCAVNQPATEQLIGELIVARLSKPDAAGIWQAPDVATESLAAITQQIDELAKAFSDGRLSLDAFSAADGRLQARKVEAQRATRPVMPEWAAESEAWDEWTPKQRRLVAGILFDAIVVEPKAVRRGRPKKGQPAVDVSRFTFRHAGA